MNAEFDHFEGLTEQYNRWKALKADTEGRLRTLACGKQSLDDIFAKFLTQIVDELQLIATHQNAPGTELAPVFPAGQIELATFEEISGGFQRNFFANYDRVSEHWDAETVASLQEATQQLEQAFVE